MFKFPGIIRANLSLQRVWAGIYIPNESMQRCQTKAKCKINDNNMGINETDQPHESAQL